MDIIEFLKAVFLGIVEGITEWLPISSTGHMILVDEFIKLNVTPEFKEFFLVVIQLGAILAVVVLYWGKLWPFYIRELPKKQRAIIAKQPVFARGIMTFVERFCDKEKWVLWFKILVACIPTIVIALPFNDFIEEKFNNYVVVSIALIVYGVIFIFIENYNKRRKATCRSLESMSFKTSLLKLIKFGFAFTAGEVLILITGVVVAFIVSILAIKFLVGYIKKHDFKVFGWYRIVLGVLVLGYFIGKNVIG